MAALGAPPGPAGYPILGVFPRARRDPLGFFTECVRRHGDVVAMRLGPHRAVLLRHPDHVKHVLQDKASAYEKGPTAARVRPLFGGSLTVVDGDPWRHRRRQIAPAFHPGHHADFAPVVSCAVAELLDRWRLRAEPVELVSEMRRLTQTIIIRACFGDVSVQEIEMLGPALDSVAAQVERRLWSPVGWLAVPGTGGAHGHRGLMQLEAFISRRIAEARRAGSPSGTLLSSLLHDFPADSLGEAELHEELKAFLFAGHTTTASSLAWTWHMLSQHPDALDQIVSECEALGSRAPLLEDLPALGHTRRVIEEVLRLYPPTWLTARAPLSDDTLDGYVIPAGGLILLSPYLTHRHPAIWEHPERFDPDRFGPACAAGRHAFAYFPFGGGPRRCIGSGFAIVEMQMIVATVVQRCRLVVLPEARVVPIAGLTLRPGPALPARVLRR